MRWLLLLIAACSSPSKLDVETAPLPDLSFLAGAWHGTTEGSAVDITFKQISNGSVLVESFGKPERQTMTVYHHDGEALIATHYCGQGNQPRLRARMADNGRLIFSQFDITDLGRDEAQLVEMMMVMTPDAFDREEVYRAPNGALDKTLWKFVRQ